MRPSARLARRGSVALALLVALAAVPTGARAQQPVRGVESIPEARIVEIAYAPSPPTFGEVFELSVTLRVGPGTALTLPDTLLPTRSAEGAGRGRSESRPAPGDSVDVSATYPVIGLREGLIEFPWMELGAQRAGGERTTYHLRLGGVDLGPYAPIEAQGISSPPRPPADVLGSGWSAWRTLGVGALAVLLLAAAALAGRWARNRGPLATARRASARQEALRELDRIHDLGWHRNGRIDDFYAATGDALRRYASAVERDWGLHLTSFELVDVLAERWDAFSGGEVGRAIRGGERIKFGGERPNAERAESDWTTVRDWLRSRPD